MAAASVLSKALQAHLGYYPGDYPLTLSEEHYGSVGVKEKRRDVPIVISAVDLKKLTRKIEGAEMDQKIKEMQKADREERVRLSRNRVQNWDNTIAGQRRKKLQARAERLAAEEAKRVELDKEYAMEETSRRKAAIDRAKALQYSETDPVKAFHSKVMLFQVLRERDMQLALKAERKSLEQNQDAKYLREAEAKLAAELEAEARGQYEARRREVHLQKEQMAQHQARLDREAAEKSSEIDEAKALETAAQEFKQQQRDLDTKRRAQRVALQQQLLELKEELSMRARAAKIQEDREEQRNHAWIARKAKQTKTRREIEKEWFSESQKIRERIGNQANKIAIVADAKTEERVAKAVQQREEEDNRREVERKRKTEQAQEELKAYFADYVRRTEAAKKALKEQEEEELRDYLRIHDEEVAAQKARKALNLKNGKDLEAFRQQQMNHVETTRRREREAQLLFDAQQQASQSTDDAQLMAYMRSMSQEPWAIKNTRLQQYIKDETERPRERVPRLGDKYRLDTALRLGLSCARYHRPKTGNRNLGMAGGGDGAKAGSLAVVGSRPGSSSVLVGGGM
ncbi:hypothetical protein HK104_005516 [Borealophlyctis nickersoniae]|nr:hypothetical protein HK104_005516 [Borealophlyctis nickersoniae]